MGYWYYLCIKIKMININKKIIKAELFSLILVLTMFSFVSAVAISQTYHNLNYLKIGPGESKDIVFGRFQNAENVSIFLKIELLEGNEIAEVIASNLNNFPVPAKSLDTPLNLRVSIPEGTPEGTEYKIVIKYAEITRNTGTGMITMTQSQTSSIPVLVQKTPVEPTPTPEGISTTTIILLIVGIIVVIVIILLLVKKKKK